MKFYVILCNDIPYEGAVFSTLERATNFLGTVAKVNGMDISEFCVQEYEGWPTCNRWRLEENQGGTVIGI